MKNRLLSVSGLVIRFGLLLLAIQGHMWAENLLSFIVVASSFLIVGLGVAGFMVSPEALEKELSKTKPDETSKLKSAILFVPNIALFIAFIALGWFVTAIAQGLLLILLVMVRAIHREVHAKADSP